MAIFDFPGLDTLDTRFFKDNRSEVLIKAIKRASDNGWKPTWVGYEDGYFKDDEHHWPLVWQAKRDPYISFKWESLIFNHDFAKALWGRPGDHPYMYEVNEYPNQKDPWQRSTQLYRWQYHLQMMVISEDPLAYLGEHIDG